MKQVFNTEYDEINSLLYLNRCICYQYEDSDYYWVKLSQATYNSLPKIRDNIMYEIDEDIKERETTFIKPPIGANPSWFIIPNRNKDLADAISRYSSDSDYFDKEHLEIIKKWAMEIVGNCETGIKISEK